MSVPPVFPASFYKLILQGAKLLGVSRANFALNAARHYLKAIQSTNNPFAKAVGSEDLAKRYAEANSKISKKWWSTVSAEERKARSQKAIQARWAKAKKTE